LRTPTEDIIRIGQVVNVNPNDATCRVAFDDMTDDGTPLVSTPLKVVQHRTVDRQDFTLPTIGEHVVCIFLPNGYEEGFVMGSIYTSASNLPRHGGEGLYNQTYSDGTQIEYDMNEKHLKVYCAGDITIEAKGVVTIKGEKVDLNP
jgi:phage baseplate assembly protein V